MTTTDLRAKYPRFIYQNYSTEIVGTDLHLKYFYSTPLDHNFTHQYIFRNLPPSALANLDYYKNFLAHLGLTQLFSYWKAACSPQIEIQPLSFTAKQTDWWHKLLIHGMGEYFYKNQIDFTAADFVQIISAPDNFIPANNDLPVTSNQVLIPLGGGKDSLITLELLKPLYQVNTFMVNPTPAMLQLSAQAGFTKPVIVESKLEHHLLDINHQGYLNGHVPFSASLALLSSFAALLTHSKHIAVSNERSSNEGNTTYLGYEINHQYTKTQEFENDFQSYLTTYLHQDLHYFSFLRPLYELQITRLFATLPQYFSSFTSCNFNFKLDKSLHPKDSLWCCHCPKCVSLALLLTPFIGKARVTEIMGQYPLDLPENKQILDELLGKLPVKPFECVLTREEANIALNMIDGKTTPQIQAFLSSWVDNPNMPTEFSQILKSAYFELHS